MQRIPALLPLLVLCIMSLYPRSSRADYDTAAALAALPWLSQPPGNAQGEIDGNTLTLSNNLLSQSFSLSNGRLTNGNLLLQGQPTSLVLSPDLFTVYFADGSVLKSSQFVAGELRPETCPPRPDDSCLAHRLPGPKISVPLTSPDGSLSAVWTASLQDGSNYIRQNLDLTVLADELQIDRIETLSGSGPELKQAGTAQGVPAVSGPLFMLIEHPSANNTAGVPWQKVASWTPAQMSWPEQHEQSWALGDEKLEPGDYELWFNYTAGGYRLELTRAALYQGEQELAVDSHFGATGIMQIDNVYHFSITPAEGKYAGLLSLRAMVRADGGTDSAGDIYLRRLGEQPRLSLSRPVGQSLSRGTQLSTSWVVGAAPEGQMRRAFSYYLERERAHPYRPFLHYNSWYDIGYFNKYSEQDVLDTMEQYRRELVEKRGVPFESFLLDDGWDDYDSLWNFHEGFPQGFAPLAEKSASYGGGIGVWLSPWGGYGEPRERRLKAAASQGYETNEGGFALSGPKYYARFSEICQQMVRDYNVNMFKFDGLGQGTSRAPGSPFASDFDAAISLIGELRHTRSDVFINLTTGTWPSPSWVLIADTIYRGGYDHELTGEGSPRQQWINYRDGQTYANVALSSPLFPLNSLMLHGVIYAKHARGLMDDPGSDLRAELRSYFATGTQLQELYITPALLSQENWDDLAASALWARQYQRALQDAHWIGGDPAAGEVYGWAGWCPEQCYLALRNPSARSQTISLEAGPVLELPASWPPSSIELHSPYAGQRVDMLTLPAGLAVSLELEPFEVLVFCNQNAKPPGAP